MRRLYSAICSLIEAKAEVIANPAPAPEPHMEGSYTQAERAGSYEPDELHADQYRIGFTMPPTPSGDSLLTETYRRW